MTTTIRISRHTHETVAALATQAGASMQTILDHAVEAYRRQQILLATNAAYQALRADAGAWEELMTERDAWATTDGDGLEG